MKTSEDIESLPDAFKLAWDKVLNRANRAWYAMELWQKGIIEARIILKNMKDERGELYRDSEAQYLEEHIKWMEDEFENCMSMLESEKKASERIDLIVRGKYKKKELKLTSFNKLKQNLIK